MKKLNQGANKITPLQKKRGSAESWMVYTGIILIVLVIFGIFIKDWGLNMKKEQRIQQCKRSVDFRNIGDQIEFIENQIESPSSAINTAIRITTGVVAYTVTAVVAGAIITVSGGTATPLVIMGIGALAGGTSAIFLAPTADDLLIGSPEDVELKCVTESNKINSRDKQEILNEISEEMYICYNMFGLGKYDNIFGPNGKRYCFICSIISFKNQNMEITQSDLIDYLSVQSPRNSDLTYADIFADCDYKGCSQEKQSEIDPENIVEGMAFDLTKDHAVIYTAYDFDQSNQDFTIFMPYNFDEVRHVCDSIYISEE